MIQDFRDLYGTSEELRVFRAPGRVNLIGEHTDYNLGFVLPIALDLACRVLCAPSGDDRLRVFSEDKDERKEWPVADIPRLEPGKHWSDYAIGVAQELLRAGFRVSPMNLLIRSTVPEGSGLSSSAALEVSCALALLGDQKMEPLELAKLCQRAEVSFVGMPCGIMDQYVSVFGQAGKAIQIDCRCLESEAVDLPPRMEIVAVNSMVKHALAQSAYKERTEECAAAVKMIRRLHPSVESLRDVDMEQLETVAPTLPPVIARRARHVVSENERVLAFVDACWDGNARAMGEFLVLSHRSLRQDYEVSCEELDFLVDTAVAIPGVYGARMTGGGFGGCTVNLLKPALVANFRETITERYQQRFGVMPEVYLCHPSDGAGEAP
jgi:galactokinase